MGDTLCRESARLFSHKAEATQELRNTLRTLEVLYWGLGTVLTIGLFLAAPWISTQWFGDHASFSQERLCYILRLMSFSFFFQWPFLFYCKGLQGLQAHLTHNSILFIGSTLRHLGAISLLYWTPSIERFFQWQVVSLFLQTALAFLCIWHKLSLFQKGATFSLYSLSRIWKFSLGLTTIGLTVIVLLQTDKLIVSRLFSLEMLGYYCLSYTVGSSMYYLVQPIAAVYYPILVQCAENKNLQLLNSVYHKASQLVIMITAPSALLLIFFSKNIVFLWTSNIQTAEQCAPIISVLTLGILFNGCISVPYLLQIAYGRTSLTLYQNLLSVLLLIPTLFYLSLRFGLVGTASFYVLLNLCYLGCVIPLLHKRFFIGETGAWYRDSVLSPILAGSIPAFLCKFLFGDVMHPVLNLISLCCTFILTTICVALFTPLSRNWLVKYLFSTEIENG